nr:hypothetical protein DM860_003448 [Ipomoea trifida]
MRFRRRTFEVAPSDLISPRRISNVPTLETIFEDGNFPASTTGAGNSSSGVKVLCMVPLVLSLVSYALINRASRIPRYCNVTFQFGPPFQFQEFVSP